MSKKRVYELAKEMNVTSKNIVEKAQGMGLDIKNHMATITDDQEKQLKTALGNNSGAKEVKQTKPQATTPPNKGQGNDKTKASDFSKPAQQSNGGSTQVKQTVVPKSNGKPVPPRTNSTNTASNQSNANKKPASTQQNRPTQSNSQKRSTSNNQTTNTGKKPVNNTVQNKNGQTNRSTQQSTNSGQQNKPNNTNNSNQTRSASNSTSNSNQNRANTTSQQNKSGGGNQQQNRNNNNNNGRRNQYNSYNNNQNKFRKGKKGKKQQQTSTKAPVPARKFRELPEVLVYTDGMNVAELSKKLYREPAEIIKKFFMMGIVATLNQSLDKEAIELLAADYGIESEEKVTVDVADIDKFFEAEEINQENLSTRPPVVTIMGHVDHGKTTLLDTLRDTTVSLGEAGGITQHIGAYQIEVDGKLITFLDTPGHAAFTSMRARGASITDVTILVVAADDGVMPQTVEAINHAKAADVPIIVAVNKIDKPEANPDHVMQELSEHGLIPEAWGGDTIFVPISAKLGTNLDDLLEMILLVSEVQELKADATQRAIGTVIEARLDKGKGPVATLLVQQGTLKVGDPIVVGNTFGRVRVMSNAVGRRLKVAGPATPVEITGLNDVPQAGDRFVVFEDEKTARQVGEERAKRALVEQRSSTNRVTLDNLFDSLKEGELKEVNVIIKADVQGSAEALAASLNKIEVEGVRVKIIHTAVGAINESDVTLAAASNAIIIGFNVRPTPQAKQQAEQDEVDIRLHSIIYNAIDEIETAMKGMLDPEYQEKITGQMIVRELYKVSKVGTIAGCYVTEGYITRDSGIRLIRDNVVVLEGKLSSLKRFKDDVKEVKLGFECGAMIENYNDMKVDDVIEAFIMEEIKVK